MRSALALTGAVCALACPVLFGLLAGERPGGWALLGIALAVPAIVLVSWEPRASGGETDRAATPGTRMLDRGLPGKKVTILCPCEL